MTTITQDITDIAGVDDGTSWTFYAKEIRVSDSGDAIISTKKVRKYPVDGAITVDLDPGPAVVLAADGKTYPFTVPEDDSELWPLIQAAVTIPPSTTHQELLDAVDAWLDLNTSLWDNIPGKPAVIAAGATQADARAAIGVNLTDLDEYEEYVNFAAFPVTGAAGILYLARDTGKLWRWSGSVYVLATAAVNADDITDAGDIGKALARAITEIEARTVLQLAPVVAADFHAVGDGATHAVSTLIGGGGFANIQALREDFWTGVRFAEDDSVVVVDPFAGAGSISGTTDKETVPAAIPAGGGLYIEVGDEWAHFDYSTSGNAGSGLNGGAAFITLISSSGGIDVGTVSDPTDPDAVVPTGTTGTNGRITITPHYSVIYVENRSGARVSVTWSEATATDEVDLIALQHQFAKATLLADQLGGIVEVIIPPGVYLCDKWLFVYSNTKVTSHGYVMFTGGYAVGGFIWLQSVENVEITGGIWDSNFQQNDNTISVGFVAAAGAIVGPASENVIVHHLTIKNAKHGGRPTDFDGGPGEPASINDPTGVFHGGGKGFTVQFGGKSIIFSDILIDNCEIGFSIEGVEADEGFAESIIVNNIIVKNSKYTGAYLQSIPTTAIKFGRTTSLLMNNVTFVDCGVGQTTDGNNTDIATLFGAVTCQGMVGVKATNIQIRSTTGKLTAFRGSLRFCDWDVQVLAAGEMIDFHNSNVHGGYNPGALTSLWNVFKCHLEMSTATFSGYLVRSGTQTASESFYDFRTIWLNVSSRKSVPASQWINTRPASTIVSHTDLFTGKCEVLKTLATAVTASATPSINTDGGELFNLASLSANITSMTTNLTGTPADGKPLRIRFTDNGTARTITWGASFTGNLATTTIVGRTVTQDLVYNSTLSKWDGRQITTDAGSLCATSPILFGTSARGIYWGAGSPEGVVTAPTGSVYFNTSGGSAVSQYNKESGSGNTGWVAVPSVATVMPAMATTAKKTANYTAAANEIIPADSTSGAITITFPTAPADKTRVVVKKVDSSSNAVNLALGGSDVFNLAGGSTTGSLTLQNQAIQAQYASATGIWYVISTDVPVSELDKKYLDGNNLASGDASMPRDFTFSQVTMTSQLLRLSFFTAKSSYTATQVRLLSGTTAAGATPSLVRAGIYSVAVNGNITLIASTASDTALFAAATTVYTKSLSASVDIVKGTRYALGELVVTAATAPTVPGASVGLNGSECAVAPRLCATLASQSDLPSSVVNASLGQTTSRIYGVVLP